MCTCTNGVEFPLETSQEFLSEAETIRLDCADENAPVRCDSTTRKLRATVEHERGLKRAIANPYNNNATLRCDRGRKAVLSSAFPQVAGKGVEFASQARLRAPEMS